MMILMQSIANLLDYPVGFCVSNKDYLTDIGIVQVSSNFSCCDSAHLPDEKVKPKLMLLLSYCDTSGTMCDN